MRYHVSFYFWLIWSVLKHRKAQKYYDQDCRRTLCDKVIHYKTFNNEVNKNPKNGGAIKSNIISNQKLSHELNKPIIKNFEKCVSYALLLKISGAETARNIVILPYFLV